VNNLNFENHTVLFISYYYLPVGGTGTPGTLRTVKFVKNIENARISILTSKLKDYPSRLPLNFVCDCPVNNEIIYRCGKLDIFEVFLKVRNTFKRYVLQTKDATVQPKCIFHTDSKMDSTLIEKKSFWQKVKDFIHDIARFPDESSPWILPAVWCGYKIIRKDDIEIIFATGQPWSSFFVAYFLSIITRKPFVVDFRDPWVGNPFHRSRGKFIDSMTLFFEKLIVTRANIVSLNTEEVKSLYTTRYDNLKKEKFIVLTNGFDKSFFKKSEVNKEYNGYLDLCHGGNLYGLQDPSRLLDAMQSINNKFPELSGIIRFYQVGRINLDYDILEKYKSLVENHQLIVESEIPYFDCLDFLGNKDVLVSVLPSNNLQIPSKIYDYIALNKQILCIADRKSALWNLIETYKFGYLLEPNNENDIIAALCDLIVKKKTSNLNIAYDNKDKFNISNITGTLTGEMLKILDSQ